MNTNTTHILTCTMLSIICLLACSGCSQKSASEEIPPHVKAGHAKEAAHEHTTRTSHLAQANPARTESAATAHKAVCTDCGVVVSIQEIEQEGKGSGLGAVAGGVTGGLIGNQVGQGTGRDLATVAGIVGGAFAGNKIEKKIKKTNVFDVAVRMDDGSERILRYETAPGVLAGDKVRVEDGRVIRR